MGNNSIISAEDIAEYFYKFFSPEVFPARKEADALLGTLARNAYALDCSWDSGQLYLVDTKMGDCQNITLLHTLELCMDITDKEDRAKEWQVFSGWYERLCLQDV